MASNYTSPRCRRTGAGGALGAAQAARPGAGQRRPTRAAPKDAVAVAGRPRQGPYGRRAGGLHRGLRLSGRRTSGQQGSRGVAGDPRETDPLEVRGSRDCGRMGAQGGECWGAGRLGLGESWGSGSPKARDSWARRSPRRCRALRVQGSRTLWAQGPRAAGLGVGAPGAWEVPGLHGIPKARDS